MIAPARCHQVTILDANGTTDVEALFCWRNGSTLTRCTAVVSVEGLGAGPSHRLPTKDFLLGATWRLRNLRLAILLSRFLHVRIHRIYIHFSVQLRRINPNATNVPSAITSSYLLSIVLMK